MLLVIGAMAEELEAAIQKLNLKPYFEAPFGPLYLNKEAQLLLMPTGIGLTNAAAGLSFCLTRFPTINQILVLGTAGAVAKHLTQGTWTFVVHALYFTADVQTYGYQLGQIPKMPPFYQSDGKMMGKLEQICNQLSQPFQKVNCASGDVFLTDSEQMQKLIEPLPIPIQIVDMETASYFQVARLFHKPIAACKIVSDLPGKKDSHAAQSFDQFLTTASQILGDFLVLWTMNA